MKNWKMQHHLLFWGAAAVVALLLLALLLPPPERFDATFEVDEAEAAEGGLCALVNPGGGSNDVAPVATLW